MQSDALHPGWANLLKWLEGHGMVVDALTVECRASQGAGYGLYATTRIPPSGTLLKIPSSSMMTIKTLSSAYSIHSKRPQLNATQLIALHMFLHRARPCTGVPSSDPLFGPYLDVLPENFESHPLVWLVKETLGQHPGSSLLEILPLSVMEALNKMHGRFEDDFQAVRNFLAESPQFAYNPSNASVENGLKLRDDPTAVDDFLWAWLSVNTRCIFHRLAAARNDLSNVAMIPIVDFANHTPSTKHLKPAPTDADVWNTAPRGKHGEAFGLLAPSNFSVQSGDELFLQYGKHANRTLFVEYGFVNPFSEIDVVNGMFEGEVDMQDLVEAHLEAKGELGKWMKDVLTDEGYWGNWTIHASPAPAYPSYRLITALRLLYIMPDLYSGGVPDSSEVDALLQPWRNTVLGRASLISDRNEAAWRQTLAEMCAQLARRGQERVRALKQLMVGEGSSSWWSWARNNVMKLWEEEVEVALAVRASVEDGLEF